MKRLLILLLVLSSCASNKTDRYVASGDTMGNPGIAVVPEKLMNRHQTANSFECQEGDALHRAPEMYNFDNGAKLYIIPCYNGAYQGSGSAYLMDKFGTTSDVIVLAYDEMSKGIVGSRDLTSVEFDKKNLSLHTHAKGRGMGDCGQSSVSKIILDESGYAFLKTVEVRSKMKCDGKMDEWPVVFKQK